MKVAAYQAPYLPFGSFDAIDLIKDQIATCEAQGVDMLCCPEAILGGLANESAGQSPATVALRIETGELEDTLSPLCSTRLTVIVGFTEIDARGYLFNAAAILVEGRLSAVYRKVFPGYRTVFRPGSELSVHRSGAARFGVMICNDIWYLEPARVMAARGAATILVPTNSGHVRSSSEAATLGVRGTTLPIARAVENSTSIVVADIAGTHGDRRAIGSSCIVDPDGSVLARADPAKEGLLVAEVRSRRRRFDPRGWDGYLNPRVTRAFLDLWRAPESEDPPSEASIVSGSK